MQRGQGFPVQRLTRTGARRPSLAVTHWGKKLAIAAVMGLVIWLAVRTLFPRERRVKPELPPKPDSDTSTQKELFEFAREMLEILGADERIIGQMEYDENGDYKTNADLLEQYSERLLDMLWGKTSDEKHVIIKEFLLWAGILTVIDSLGVPLDKYEFKRPPLDWSPTSPSCSSPG